MSDATPAEPKTTLAEQLKRLRLAKGHVTARGFAKLLGISENRYSRYERGEAVPKLDLIWAICEVLNITPNELYGWDPGEVGMLRQHAVQPAQVGFAEAPASLPLKDASTAQSGAVGASRGAVSPIDVAAWRLANLFAAIDPAVGEAAEAEVSTASRLSRMRAASEHFVQLRRDPFETLALLLQAPHIAGLPPPVGARLASEIEAFLVTIGSDMDKG